MASKDEERADGAEEEEREDADSPAEDGDGEGPEEDGGEGSDDLEDGADEDDAEAGDDSEEGSDEEDEEGGEDSDEGSDEEDEEADAEEQPAAAAAPKRGKRKGRGKGGDVMSPGARLAAAKARKARKKQAKRGKDAEVVESAVLKKADRATEWAQENRRTLWIALAAVAAIVIGTVVWNQQSSARETEASAALWEAVEAARAEIRPEGEAGFDDGRDDDRETFPDVQTRAETALDRFQKVIRDYGGTDPAVWARLGEGGALMELGRAEEAREAYQKALGEGGDDPVVAWRALEGIAFTHESDEAWDQALARFQELGDSGDGELRDIADYHIARIHLAQGDEVRAKELLRGLVERLRGEREPGAVELSYVLSQAEIRLMEIDSSFAQQRPQTPSLGGFPGAGVGGGAGGGNPNQQLNPEQMQKLLEMLEQRGMGGEPGGGAGGEGE